MGPPGHLDADREEREVVPEEAPKAGRWEAGRVEARLQVAVASLEGRVEAHLQVAVASLEGRRAAGRVELRPAALMAACLSAAAMRPT